MSIRKSVSDTNNEGTLPFPISDTPKEYPSMENEAVRARMMPNKNLRIQENESLTLEDAIVRLTNGSQTSKLLSKRLISLFACLANNSPFNSDKGPDSLGKALHRCISFFDCAGIYDQDILDFYIILAQSDADKFWRLYSSVVYGIRDIDGYKMTLQVVKDDTTSFIDAGKHLIDFDALHKELIAASLFHSLKETLFGNGEEGDKKCSCEGEEKCDNCGN